MVCSVMLFVRETKKTTPSFDDFSRCVLEWQNIATLLFLQGGTIVHWHSEKASIQSLFLPHTLAEWETSDLSLLYYPDAPAPLGNEILYYVHHAMRSSARLKNQRGKVEVVGEVGGRLRMRWVPGGLGQTLHLSQLGPPTTTSWLVFRLYEQY